MLDSSLAAGQLLLEESATPAPTASVASFSSDNYPPWSAPDSYELTHDTVLNEAAPGVLANDFDDGPFWAVLDSGPSNAASFQLNSDGSFTYEPNPGFAGSDSFTYHSSDGEWDSPSVTVDLNVINWPPQAADDEYQVLHDTTLTVEAAGVLWNDFDVDRDAMTPTVVDEPTNGTVELNADGSFEYVPDAGFFGTDTFTYQLNDGITDGNLATVTIDVTDNWPLAEDDEYFTLNDVPLTIDPAEGVLTNDYDPDGDAMTAVLVTQAQYGTVSLNPDGSFTYNAESEYVGWDEFQYRVDDPFVQGGTATVRIGVNRLMIELGVPDASGGTTWQDVTNATTNVWAGEQINLQTVLFGPGVVPMSNWSWTVPGDIFAGWIATTDLGAVVDVGPSAFSQPQLTFHWSSEGTYQVSVGVDVGNQRGTKSTTFVVDRPDVGVLSITSEVVDYTFNAPTPDIVSFGDIYEEAGIDVYPLVPYEGIAFARSQSDAGGEYQWVQTVNSVSSRTLSDGTVQSRVIMAVLDTHYPWPDPPSDTPSDQLHSIYRRFYRRDDFTMYLLWKPSTPAAQYVPLRKVDWFWTFEATSNDGDIFQYVQLPDYSRNPADEDATEHPEWNGNVRTFVDNWEK